MNQKDGSRFDKDQVPYGSVKGSSVAPRTIGAERAGFEGDYAQFNAVNRSQDFGGRASGAKSASLPPDA